MLENDLTVGEAEDASESCNKLYRQNRQFHVRKNSRENNLEDVFNRALDSTDPIVSSFSQRKRQNTRMRKAIPKEVLNLLKPPDTEHFLGESDDTDVTEAELDVVDELPEGIAESLDEFDLPEDPYYYELDEEDTDND